ncbi:hypothetical protein C7212DRAFT_340488 [Tuber magnatum]|uniref:Uncharacterized protein n=1 Tax=Tuber magnatum TaxID=42249 RepID=A0A317T2Y0_9PEZI|nr:hypothetical protein C7212DRAFT_340488 [Tuber magnatum]
MSTYHQSTHVLPGEYLLGYEQGDSYFENAMYPITVPGYEEPTADYTADATQNPAAISRQPVFMEDILAYLSPSDTPNTSPSTLYEEPLWTLGSPEDYFCFESSMTSPPPVDTPIFSTPSSGDQIPQTPPQTPASPEPSSPPPPAPDAHPKTGRHLGMSRAYMPPSRTQTALRCQETP